MNLHQRIVHIDELDQTFVTIQRCRKELGVHLRAVGALQIVEVDDHHLRIRISTHRTSAGWQHARRIRSNIPLREPRQRARVLRQQEIHRLLPIRLAGQQKCHRDGVISIHIALLSRTNGDLILRRHSEFRPDHHFDLALQRRYHAESRICRSGSCHSSRSGGCRRRLGVRGSLLRPTNGRCDRQPAARKKNLPQQENRPLRPKCCRHRVALLLSQFAPRADPSTSRLPIPAFVQS